MTIGASKYDPILSEALLEAGAVNGALVIMGGAQGSGFAVQMEANHMINLPDILTDIAKAVRSDLAGMGFPPLKPRTALVDEDGERFRMMKRMAEDEHGPEATMASAYLDARAEPPEGTELDAAYEFGVLIEVIDHVREQFAQEPLNEPG